MYSRMNKFQTKVGKQMSQFCRMNKPILFLVKYTKAFNEVLQNRFLSILANCGQDW